MRAMWTAGLGVMLGMVCLPATAGSAMVTQETTCVQEIEEDDFWIDNWYHGPLDADLPITDCDGVWGDGDGCEWKHESAEVHPREWYLGHNDYVKGRLPHAFGGDQVTVADCGEGNEGGGGGPT